MSTVDCCSPGLGMRLHVRLHRRFDWFAWHPESLLRLQLQCCHFLRRPLPKRIIIELSAPGFSRVVYLLYIMAITIHPPVVEDVDVPYPESDVDSMSVDSDGGVDLAAGDATRPSKRPRLVEGTNIGAGVLTPGEVVTDDPQWMRLVAPYLTAILPRRRAH